MNDSFIELVLNVDHEAGTHAPYADGDKKRLVVSDPITLSKELLVKVEKK